MQPLRIRKPASPDREARAARISQMMHRVKNEAEEADESWSNGKPRYDWDAIKEFYLTYQGDIDLAAVARQFGVPAQTVYNRSGKEGWRDERVYTQARMLRDKRAERNVETARKAQEFDDRAYETAKLGLNLVTSRMAQIADQFTVQKIMFERALERAARGETVTKSELWSSINYRELVELGKSLELFQNAGRRALGTDVQTIAMIMDGPDGVRDDRTATIVEELGTPDKDRLAALVDALVDANIMQLKFGDDGEIVGLAANTIEGEAVEVIEPEEPRAIES